MAQKPAEYVGFKAPEGTNRLVRSAAKRDKISPSEWLRRAVLERLGSSDTVRDRGRQRKNGDA